MNSYKKSNSNGTYDIYVLIYTMNAFTIDDISSSMQLGSFNKYSSDIVVSDFDGDGKSEIMIVTNTNTNEQTYQIVKYGENSATITGHMYALGEGSHKMIFTPVDFNGDGKSEIMATWDNGSKVYDPISSAQNSEIYSTTLITSYVNGLESFTYTGDFNGDRITDLLTANQTTGWHLYYGTGTGYIPGNTPQLQGLPGGHPNMNDRFYIRDFDGDGKDDIIDMVELIGTIDFTVFYSIPQNSFFPISGALTYNETTDLNKFFCTGNFSGDGRAECYCDISYIDPHRCDWGDPQEIKITSNFISFPANQKKRLITSIVNGLNEKTEIEYKPLCYTEGDQYENFTLLTNNPTHLSGFPSDISLCNSTSYVVSSIKINDGVEGYITKSYTYEDALYHRTKRAFLGFLKINETLSTGSLISTQKELLNSAETLTLKEIDKEKPVGTNIASSVYQNNVYSPYTGVYFPYVSEVDIQNGLTNGNYSVLYNYNTTDIAYGNLSSKTVNYLNESGSDVTSYTYMTAGTWYPSKIQHVTLQKNRDQETSVTLKTDYDYYTSGSFIGLPKTVINNPDLPNYLTTTYSDYDQFGNCTQINTSAADIESRTVYGTYDTKGRYLHTYTNPLSQVTTIEHEGKYGNITSITDINGLETNMEYDGFGHQTKIIQPDGITVNTSLNWDINGTHNNDLFFKSVYQSTANYSQTPLLTYYDYLQRPVQTSYKAFNGEDLLVDVDYNNKGQIEKKSEPYYLNTDPGSIIWENYKYDIYNRLDMVISPSKSIKYEYNLIAAGKYSITTTNNLTSHSTTKKYNSLKQLYQNEESQGNTINYFYNSFDKTRQIDVIADGTTGSTVITYDNYGNQNTLTDPDAGITHYTYNSLGELIYQKDANQKEYNLHYDKLGRIYSSENNTEGTTYYIYDTEEHGVGKLAQITGPNGINYYYKYDDFGRPWRESELIDANTYNTDYQYDEFNNINKIMYPSGLAVNKNYNLSGYLTTITRADDNSNSLIYQNNAINNLGQVEQYDFGNDVRTTKTYDPNDHIISSIEAKIIGNENSLMDYEYGHDPYTKFISARGDVLTAKSESFGYDTYDRLTTITGNNGVPSSSMTYYDNGNINNNSLIGDYTYGENGAGVHAVTSVPENTEIPQTRQEITYTPFNKVATITEGDDYMEFTYGPDHQRKKTLYQHTGLPDRTKYYIGSYEKQITGSNTRELTYIDGSDGLAAIFEKVNGTSENMYYINKDHLGSIIGATDQNGNIVSQASASFDAWGNRRDPATWQPYTSTPPELFFGRGFTGHEHLEMFGLINMNGRLYDPKLRRFLSPDVDNQTPDNSQNYNRYSYCMNNPLNFVDPSGYEYDDDGGGDEDYYGQYDEMDEQYVYRELTNFEKFFYNIWFHDILGHPGVGFMTREEASNYGNYDYHYDENGDLGEQYEQMDFEQESMSLNTKTLSEYDKNTDTWVHLFDQNDQDYQNLKYVDFYNPDLTNFDCNQDFAGLWQDQHSFDVLSNNNDGSENLLVKIPWGVPKNEPKYLDKLKKSIENNPNRIFLRTQNLDANQEPIRGSYNYYSISYTNPFCTNYNIELPLPFFKN